MIDLVFENELLPKALQSEFTALRSVLASGLPVARNKMSGHGQGQDVREVPAYISRFALNQAAANIILLIEAHESI